MKRMYIPFLVWTLLVTASRSIRLPNDFAEAHWLLDYRFGFIKRGLIGTLCNLVLGLEMSPALIVLFSGVVYALAFVTILYVSWRINYRCGDWMIGLAFACSPFVVMGAHLFGYFDMLLFSLAVFSIILALRGRDVLAAILSSLAILIYESYLLFGFPLVFLAAMAGDKAGKKWLLLPPVVFVAQALAQFTSGDALRGQLAQYLNSYGFVATRSDGVAKWQTTSLFQFFQDQHQDFLTRLSSPDILPVVLPTLAFFLLFLFVSFRKRLWVVFFASAATLAPLLMHLVAWDTARIWMYPIGSAFLAIWVLAETQESKTTLWIALLPLFLLVLVWNATNHVPLMDGDIDRFTQSMRWLLYLPTFWGAGLSCIAHNGA